MVHCRALPDFHLLQWRTHLYTPMGWGHPQHMYSTVGGHSPSSLDTRIHSCFPQCPIQGCQFYDKSSTPCGHQTMQHPMCIHGSHLCYVPMARTRRTHSIIPVQYMIPCRLDRRCLLLPLKVLLHYVFNLLMISGAKNPQGYRLGEINAEKMGLRLEKVYFKVNSSFTTERGPSKPKGN